MFVNAAPVHQCSAIDYPWRIPTVGGGRGFLFEREQTVRVDIADLDGSAEDQLMVGGWLNPIGLVLLDVAVVVGLCFLPKPDK